MTNKFSIDAEMLRPLNAKTILGQLPAGLTDQESERLDWHIRNAVLAVSGTAQLTSYSGLVDFVAAHYAALLNVPQDDAVNDLTVKSGLKNALAPIRKAGSLAELHSTYQVLVFNIGVFLHFATDPSQQALTPEQAARRRAIAEAIWNRRREDEDREDQDLDDLPSSHSVWAEADAVLAVLALEPAAADTADALRYRWLRADRLRLCKSECWAPRIGIPTPEGNVMYRYVQTPKEHDISVDLAMKREPNPV